MNYKNEPVIWKVHIIKKDAKLNQQMRQKLKPKCKEQEEEKCFTNNVMT
jgi:hypothetical protein